MDDVLLGKVLPALRYTDMELEPLREVEELAQYPRSLAKLERMYDQELRELNYWR